MVDPVEPHKERDTLQGDRIPGQKPRNQEEGSENDQAPMEHLLEEVVLGPGREVFPSQSEEILASRYRFPQVSSGHPDLARSLKAVDIPQGVKDNQTRSEERR